MRGARERMNAEANGRNKLDGVLPWVAAVLGAAVILMAALAAFVAISLSVQQRPPLLVNSCPAVTDTSGDPRVPSRPTVPGAARQLIPDRSPAVALLCQYPLRSEGGALPGSLAGRGTRLRGDLASIPATLARVPAGHGDGSCGQGAFASGYLLLLTYQDGSGVWVATRVDPGTCVSTTNGEFTTGADIGALFSAAQQSGEWPRG